MTSRVIRTVLLGVAAVCAVANAVIHLILVPSHLEEQLYIGVLFLAGSLVMLGVAAGLVVHRRRTAAWLIGSSTSAAMIAGFLLSRTVGLPGYHEDGWELPYGPLSLIVEALFVTAFVAWLRRTDTAPTGRPQPRPVHRVGAR
ncbi:hypothetical protein [Kitasatospora sp. NPDC093558]|uniref:hypothetical protein n=1 Tax=Kitasatospora sp. NPDC093558 TaxID=3155201 RepID=UPI00342B4B31